MVNKKAIQDLKPIAKGWYIEEDLLTAPQAVTGSEWYKETMKRIRRMQDDKDKSLSLIKKYKAWTNKK